MIERMRKSYEIIAEGTNWKKKSKTELANAYLDAKDDFERESYFAGLMMKYWFFIYQYAKTSRLTRLDLGDFASWVAEAIMIALNYGAWRKPDNHFYNDPNGAEKMINRCLFSIRNKYYYLLNMDKRKANYVALSLDVDHSSEDDYYMESVDTLADTLVDENRNSDVVESLLQNFIMENRISHAIIVANICYADNVFKKERIKDTNNATMRTKYTLSERLLVKRLRDGDSKEYFCKLLSSSYNVDEKVVKENYHKLVHKDTYIKVRAILDSIKNDKGVIESLCC